MKIDMITPQKKKTSILLFRDQRENKWIDAIY